MNLHEKIDDWKKFPNALGSEAQAAVIVAETSLALGESIPESVNIALRQLALRGTMRDIAQAIGSNHNRRFEGPSFHDVVDTGAAASGISWTEAIATIVQYLEAAKYKPSSRD